MSAFTAIDAALAAQMAAVEAQNRATWSTIDDICRGTTLSLTPRSHSGKVALLEAWHDRHFDATQAGADPVEAVRQADRHYWL